MGMPRTRYFVLAVLLAVVSACGQAGDKPKITAVAHPYHGPLYVRGAAEKHPHAGAAGNIVHCRAWGHGGFSAAKVYPHGAVADSPEHALETASHEGVYEGIRDGLQIAKKERDRVLYILPVHGIVKRAFIVHNGPATKGAGGFGWYLESWASCDYSEFPRSYADALGLQIWTDAAGVPIPTKTIQGWIGPKHCDWQSMTFLEIGTTQYVRRPQPDLADYFTRPYQENTTLPGNAVDTGFQRDGKKLWLSRDKQIAYVGTESRVEAWPRTIRPLLCA